MPELPEVETSRLGIKPHIDQQKITDTIIRQYRLRWPVPEKLPVMQHKLLCSLGPEPLSEHFNPGYFSQQLSVYAKAGQKCLQCSHTIQQISQQQRSTFYCPRCQR